MYEWAKQNISRYYLPIIIGVVAMLLGVAIGYSIGLRNVSDHGSGADAIGNQLEQASTNINNAANGISQAAGTADQIGAGIGAAKESAGYLQHTADTSAELIADCQRIIRQVRARGKEKAPQN